MENKVFKIKFISEKGHVLYRETAYVVTPSIEGACTKAVAWVERSIEKHGDESKIRVQGIEFLGYELEI